MKGYARIAWLMIVGMGVLLIDFLTKAYIYNLLLLIEDFSSGYPYGGIGLFKIFFGIEGSISLAINRGAAWGIFSEFQLILLVIRILVILGLVVYLCFFNKNRGMGFPFVLIISGAIGNVVDYFLYGYVIDFIHFKFWGYAFPVFNIADSVITIGVIWLFFVAFLNPTFRNS